MASRPIGTIADDARLWAALADNAGEVKCAQLASMAASLLELARQEYEAIDAHRLPFPAPEAPGSINVGLREFLCCEHWLTYPTPGSPTRCPDCGSTFTVDYKNDWSPRAVR